VLLPLLLAAGGHVESVKGDQHIQKARDFGEGAAIFESAASDEKGVLAEAQEPGEKVGRPNDDLGGASDHSQRVVEADVKLEPSPVDHTETEEAEGADEVDRTTDPTLGKSVSSAGQKESGKTGEPGKHGGLEEGFG